MDASPAAGAAEYSRSEGLQATGAVLTPKPGRSGVEHDEGLLARLQRVDRPLADPDFCRHRVVTEKEFAGTSRNRSTSAGIDISMTWERLST